MPSAATPRTSALKVVITLGVLVCFVVGRSVFSYGQTSDTGLDQFGTFQRNHIQTINLYNLNNHIEVPIFSKTARNLTFSAKWVWDLSDSFSPVPIPAQNLWQPNYVLQLSDGVISYRSEIVSTLTCAAGQTGKGTIIQFDSVVDQNGTSHRMFFGPTQLPQITVGAGCPSGSATFFTSDGWLLTVFYTNQNCSAVSCITAATETDPAGNLYSGGITDPNGNRIIIDGANTVTDSTGNRVFFSSGGNALSYPTQGGGTASVQLTSSVFTFPSSFGCLNYQFSNGVSLFTGIVLPDGSQYSFVYESVSGTYPSTNVTGRLHSITGPAGGTYTYTYSGGTNGVNCTDGKPVIMTITGSDGSVWTYNRIVAPPGVSSPTVTVATDPSCNDAVYSFDRYTGLQMQMQVYQGTAGTAHCTATTKTLLKTVVTCYNGNFSNCTTQGPASGGSAPPSRVDAYTYLPGLAQPSLSEQKYNANTLLTQDNEFDFGVNTGAAPTSTPLQATMTTYATIGSNILNRPSCVQVTAGSSPATCGTVTSTTNAITKYLNYDSHGNVGTIQQWVSGSTYLSRSFIYTPTGLIQTTTDVNGAQTTVTYNACNGSYPDTITQPLSLSQTLTWDCNGGVVTQTHDENGQPMQYQYSDPFWRTTQVTDPLGNYTTYSYTPTTEESVLHFVNPACSTCTDDELTTYDPLGRPHLSQKRQGPGSTNWDTVVTGYDGNSRVASFGLPCVAQQAQPCASSATTTSYDGLSRPLMVQDGGTGYTQYSYSPGGSFKNDVLVTVGPAPTGENTKRRQLEYDALGRLKSVCEITSATGSGSCSQAAAATGFRTAYTYDALANLTGVSQNAQGSPIQTRSYAYDGLSRLTSETNPESGNTTYIYDSVNLGGCISAGAGNQSGNLLMKTDANGNGTCFTYDGLHRTLSIGQSYNNSPNASVTADHCFVYDSATVNGVAMPNAEGHLARAYTTAQASGCGATKITDEGLGYDAVGRQTDLYQSTPHSAGYYHTTAAYWANGAPQSLSGIPGLSTVSYGVDGEGRLKTTSLGSTSLVSNTTFNPSSQPLTVSLGLGETAGYTYDSNTGRMSNYTFTVGSPAKSMLGGLTWNANGTLRTLGITDGFNSGGTQTCNYGTSTVAGYDDLGRLVSANCGSVWSQTFSYDTFGNITKSGSTSWMPGYNQATNRYTLGGSSYDAEGNLLTDTFHTYGWTADNHVAKIDSTACGTNGTCLTYDALGRVVERSVNSTYMEMMYSPLGFMARMGGQTLQVAYLDLPGGERAWVTPTEQRFWFKDWLGTARLSSVRATRLIDYDRGFAPFGETYANFGRADYKDFTGDMQEDLGQADLFNTPNREFHPTQGRWISPDPASFAAADPGAPQSWNQYAYVMNNPLIAFDPLGLFCVWDDGSFDANDDPGTGDPSRCGAAGGTWFGGEPSGWDPNAGDWSGQASGEFASFAKSINPNGVGSDWMNDGTVGGSASATFNSIELIVATPPGLGGMYNFILKPGVPPPSERVAALLKCIASTLGTNITATSTTDGQHQDPGHRNRTSVDVRPPRGFSADQFFCAAGGCGAPFGLNEGVGGQSFLYTQGLNYHLQLVAPRHLSPRAPNAIPSRCSN
jgi:RHS repeat-associated protein